MDQSPAQENRGSEPWSDARIRQQVEEHYQLVYEVALRLVREPSLADDITQEVFLAFCRQPPRLTPEVPLAAWLVRVTRHAAWMRMRSDHRRHHHHQQYQQSGRESPPRAQASPAEGMDDDELTLLQRALDGLSAEIQLLVILHYRHGLSHSAIAKAVDLPVGTVGSRLARAMHRLHEQLLNQGVELGIATIPALLVRMPAATIPAHHGHVIVAAAQAGNPALASPGYIASLSGMAAACLSLGLVVATVPLASPQRIAAARAGSPPQRTATLTVPADAGLSSGGIRLELPGPCESWYALGDAIDIPLAVHNVGNAPISIFLDRSLAFSGHVHLVDDHGHPCQAMADPMMWRHNSGSYLNLLADERSSNHEYLAYWVVIDHPGTYTLWYDYDLPVRDPPRHDRSLGQRYPLYPLWHGHVASNSVTVHVISDADHARLSGNPLPSGDYRGLSLQLQAVSTDLDIGEPLSFQLLLSNTGSEAMTLPWYLHGRLSRVTDTGIEDALTAPIPYPYQPPQQPTPVQLAAHGSVLLPLSANDEHLHHAVDGVAHYRAEWLQAVIPDLTSTTVIPATPLRTVSNQLDIHFHCTKEGVGRFLAQAVGAWQQGYLDRNHSRVLQAVSSNLQRLSPFLSDYAQGDGERAGLARDLQLAAACERLPTRPWTESEGKAGDMVIDGTGAVRLGAASLARLVGIDLPQRDPEWFAERYAHLQRCAGLAWIQASTVIASDDALPYQVITRLSQAIRHACDRQQVYLYRLSLRIPDAPFGFDTVNLDDDGVPDMTIAIDPATAGAAAAQVRLLASRDSGSKAETALLALDAHALTELPHLLRASGTDAHMIMLLPAADLPCAEIIATVRVLRQWRPGVPIGLAQRSRLPPPKRITPQF